MDINNIIEKIKKKYPEDFKNRYAEIYRVIVTTEGSEESREKAVASLLKA